MAIEDPEQILSKLQTLASEKRLADGASLSEDGATITVPADGTQLAARTKLTLTWGDKSCEYTAAAVYLQILDPDQRLVTYRSICKKYGVTDPVGVSHKPIVLGFFFGTTDTAQPASDQVAAPSETAVEKEEVKPSAEGEQRESVPNKEHRSQHPQHKSSSSHREHRKDRESSKRKKDHHQKSSRHRVESASEKKKKHKSLTVTNEELFSNLKVVVGKRSTDAGSSTVEEITAALSADGFDVTPELLEEHREKTQQLMANEIPVGDSASILRAANPRKDLSRVLEIFNETVHPKKTNKPSGAALTSRHTTTTTPTKKSYLTGKKPVIVVPRGMTTPLTLVNAYEFLAKGRFVPRDVLLKQQKQQGGGSSAVGPRPAAQTLFTRKVGGTAALAHAGFVEYEITDNPKRLLGTDPKEWERIVAVFVLGHKWQFADWLFHYDNPVHLFTKAFGFYIGLEGDKVPDDAKGWAVRYGTLNRDKRGLDSVTLAAFWNGLDEFMSVHKRELLPQSIEE